MKRKLFSLSPSLCVRGCTRCFILFSCFFLLTLSAVAQDLKVSGTVTDPKGSPLTGVSVNIKKTTGGTATDGDGKFTLTVPDAKAVLVFSFVGYTVKEVPVEGKTTLNVVMQESASGLDEVIVVGYGGQKKGNVTGAVSTVNAKAIEERQAIDVFDALQGQAAGVQIAQEGGRPGAGSSVRIRGIGTLQQGGAEPLYIVDGAQGVNIDGINPGDIESITILKDAASAAIYGSRSANGVVLITTKKGKEGKPTLDLRYLASFNTLAHKVAQANAAERRLLDRKRGGSGNLNADSLNPSLNADNDYQDLLSRTAARHQVDLSLSGGTRALDYYASMGYLREEGIIVNSWADIVRGRFNVNYRPNDKFAYGNRIQLSYQTENRINEGNSLYQGIQRPPNFRVWLPDGNLAGNLGGRKNPLAEALLGINKFDIVDVSMYNYISYNFMKDLKFTVDANVKANYQHNLQFSPKLLSNTGQDNSGADFTDWKTYWMAQAYLNYKKKLGDHTLTGLLGVSADREFNRGADIEGSKYASESVITLNSPQEYEIPQTRESRNSMVSAYARLEYDYKGKYLFTGNFRADASSRFGIDNRWGYFPAASIGWRFTDEPFMNWATGFLSDGKVRVGYGITGNERIGAYDALQVYTFGNNYYNGVSGVAPSAQFGNSKLSWEEPSQLSAGIELSFLNGRINLTADYYDKITRKLLYSAPLDFGSGYSTVRVNVGSLQNKGFEFVLNGYPVRSKDVTWNMSYNMSFNNATIRELYGNIPLAEGVWRTDPGSRLGDFFGWKALGVYQYDQSNAYTENWDRLTPVFVNGTFTGYTLGGKPYTGVVKQLRTQGTISKGGDMIWENNKKDSVIDDADRRSLGNAQPKFTAGLYNVVSYKQFSVSFNFYISWGGVIYNRARHNLNTNATTNVTPDPEYIRDSWWNQGDITKWPIPRNNSMGNARELSSLYIEDASFIRLRNVRLTYNIPGKTMSKIKMRGASVYVYGNNILTWTDYNGYDPEIAFNNPLQMGQDNGRYPRKREYGAGINLNF
jgi:TonB-linked SusC/RagA family outer membrane protein